VVRIGDKTETKTYDTLAQAQAWANPRETALRKRVVLTAGSFGELLLKIMPKAAESAQVMLRYFAKLYAAQQIKEMDSEWWIAQVTGWEPIKNRGLSASSRMSYYMVLRGAMKRASFADRTLKLDFAGMDEAYEYLMDNDAIGSSERRKRRLTDAELAAIKLANPPTCEIPLNDLIDFALLTGMRRSEILRITWADINGAAKRPMVWLYNCKDPKKKQGNDYNVPLLNGALEILRRQPKIFAPLGHGPRDARRKALMDAGVIFPWAGVTVSNRFRAAAKMAGVKNARFHDLRHEALTRLSNSGYRLEQVQLVSRHKQVTTLMRYLHLEPESLHDGPDVARRRAFG
jgi:integrase